MVPTTLLTTLLLVFVVAAKPIIRAESLLKLPIHKNLNFSSDIVRKDQRRAKILKAKGHAIANGDIDAFQNLAGSNAISSLVENQVVSYIANVSVGSPATQCK